MRLFVDTSTLFKKYVEEMGSRDADMLFSEATEMVVSPITRIEMHSAIAKYVRERWLSAPDAKKLSTEIKKDFAFYSLVYWNENLEEKSIELAQALSLKALDAIQLASGVLSKADLFVTSDKRLFDKASKVIHKTRFIR